MTILFSGKMTINATDSITLSGNTQSLEILNLSHFDLQISSDTMGSWKLPARCTKTYKVSPSDYIQFTLADNPFQPTPLSGEYIQVTQSTEATESGITPLSMIPAFSTDVTVDGGVNASITGPVSLAAGTQVQATLAAGSIVNLAQGAQVQANLAAGSVVDINNPVTVQEIVNGVNTTVTNEYVSSNELVVAGSFVLNIANMAAGVTIYPTNGIPLGMYDGVYVLLESAGGYAYSLAGGHGVLGPVSTPNFSNVASMGSAGGTSAYSAWFAASAMDSLNLWITNNSGATIAADTLTCKVYLVRASQGVTQNPVQVKSALSTGNQSLGSIALSGSVAANSYGAWEYSLSIATANFSKAIFASDITGSTYLSQSSGASVNIEICGSSQNPVSGQPWQILSQNNGANFYGNQWLSYDSGDLPGILSGYPYLCVRARMYNPTSSALSPTATIYNYCYWQE